MFEKYISEQLLHELPRPLLNFLWYLWDTYYETSESEFRVTLQSGDNIDNQRFVIHSASITVEQNFGCNINVDIAIRKCGTRYFMEHD